MPHAKHSLAQSASSYGFHLDTINDDSLSVFANVRARLFGIACHVLGSAAEAEDIVQDVWLRWQCTDRSVVANPPAFLAITTTRMCINLVCAARWRRETYLDTSLPEPVDTSDDPRLRAERGEALRFAVLVLLERLSPLERAAYILHEAFDYPYARIADLLQLEEANARQLVFRARKHIGGARRKRASVGEQRRLLDAFIAATTNGDMASLEGVLAEDVFPSLAPCRGAGHSFSRRAGHGFQFRRCFSSLQRVTLATST